MTTYEAISVAFQSNLVLIGVITVIIMIVTYRKKVTPSALDQRM